MPDYIAVLERGHAQHLIEMTIVWIMGYGKIWSSAMEIGLAAPAHADLRRADYGWMCLRRQILDQFVLEPVDWVQELASDFGTAEKQINVHEHQDASHLLGRMLAIEDDDSAPNI